MTNTVVTSQSGQWRYIIVQYAVVICGKNPKQGIFLFSRALQCILRKGGLNAIMKQVRYRAEFIFSKKIPRFFEGIISREYLRLREYAIQELNQHFQKWNSEFTEPESSKDDKLAEYGGTAYCEYIREKIRTVLEQVNKKHPSKIIKLDAGEIGNIIAKTRIGNITMEFLYALES